MTENEEVLKYIKQKIEENPSMEDLELYKLSFYPSEMMILVEAIEEIQAYRAIGTVKELQSMKEHGAFTGTELAQIAVCQMELQKYMSIGTVEEFKSVKDKVKCEDCAGCTEWKCDCANVRARAIDEFAEAITVKSAEASIKAVIDGGLAIDVVTLDYVSDVVMEIAEELRCKE